MVGSVCSGFPGNNQNRLNDEPRDVFTLPAAKDDLTISVDVVYWHKWSAFQLVGVQAVDWQ